jgi:single-stranded DNA-binding protein
MNKETISILGRIAVKPELLKSKENNKYLKVRIAVNKNKKNNKETNEVTYYDILIFDKRVEKFSKLTKGKLVYTSGIIDIKAYLNKQGLPKVSLNVIAKEFFILDTKIFK